MSDDDEYRTAELEAADWQFKRMPTAAQQRAEALEREAKLKAEAEASLSRRSKLAVPISVARGGLTRQQIFDSLRRFLKEEEE
jgi:hypothetical protein